MTNQQSPNISLDLAVLTISDSRTEETDTSGRYLAECIQSAGHSLAGKKIIPDDVYKIRAVVSQWISDESVNGIIITGGTGFTNRDSTPEAVKVLFDKEVLGFGEMFRQLSYDDIGNSTIQSRSLAGLANNTIIFCLPGSNGACRLGWEKLIKDQLDSNHKPCNFAELIIKKSQSH
ncbi:MAG: molybdenum cofactor biosynthesis protein B [Cellvibrionaceae bacterium]